MLNIIKSKLNTTYKKKGLNDSSIAIYNRDVIPAVRNWKSSIYAYNKNAINLIPIKSKYVMKLIKAYFNLYNLQLESLLRKNRLRRRFRKISTNRIFISDGEFKHTNDKVNITLYVYNKQKLNYLLKLKKRYLTLFKKAKFARKLKLIKNVGLNILCKHKQKSILLSNLLPKYNTQVNTAQNIYYTRFIKKSFKRLKFYMYYKQMLYINKAKFENTYLQGLINLVRNIFNKNVEFNIINLKYFYFNSKIFTQPLELKLKKKRNVLRYLKVLIRKAKIKNVKLAEKSKKFFNFNIFNSDNFLQQDNTKSKYLKKIILSNLKYKRVSGVRLEAAGRLTRRFSASRSQRRTKYKGNLENVYSSFKGYPTPVLRGNDKANLQYTVINSTSRVGAFGVKGWISST
uniref:Small ribosomal subunit protein uS3m n=1 Tax=Penicillium urticae TaxID=29844 RepID=RMS5_PENUR|nr:RecName: Full=Small ribosomal subunit protein uS3m; AltName: Full=Ribosomal protein S5, mitochondrial [Penicillium urticae]BAA03421.1 S5 protein [Penicillium urticae]